jgi:SAM-dependent methyltransferase
MKDNESTSENYAAFHRPRFEHTLELIKAHCPESCDRILDIGPSPLTKMIRKNFSFKVDTMGLEEYSETDDYTHHHVDLNDVSIKPDNFEKYQFIVFGEVLEHLPTSPTVVLQFLNDCLSEKGVLILQTPNAVALNKRIKMMLGLNPFELIRINKNNPGHFREYTLNELIAYVDEANFDILEVNRKSYFDIRFSKNHDGSSMIKNLSGSVRNFIYRSLPPSFREGITMVLVKR